MKLKEKHQKIAQIDSYMKALASATLFMSEKRHILDSLQKEKEIRLALDTKFKDSYGAHAFNHLILLLWHDFIRDLSRLFLDKDRRTASLPNVFRKASEPAIHEILRKQRCCTPDDQWYNDPSLIGDLSKKEYKRIKKQLQETDRADCEKSFDNCWDEINKAMNELRENPVALKIKNIRDKYYAHLEMVPLDLGAVPFDITGLELTYSEVLSFADECTNMVIDLNLVLTGNRFVADNIADVYYKRATDMWRILANL